MSQHKDHIAVLSTSTCRQPEGVVLLVCWHARRDHIADKGILEKFEQIAACNEKTGGHSLHRYNRTYIARAVRR